MQTPRESFAHVQSRRVPCDRRGRGEYKIRPCLSVLALATAILLGAELAEAQEPKPAGDLTEMSLEKLMEIEVDSVYGASRYLQKVTEAPASVSIVTAEEIQKYGYRTLADVLRSVRGFYVTYDRNYSYLGVRGFSRPGDYNSRILLLVDGHRANDNVFDQALLGTEFPIDIDLIERIEVIRGPNSSLYVASAFLGVVNIVTKRGRNLKGLNLSGELASYGTYKGLFSYGKRFPSGLETLLSASDYDSQGQRRLYFKEFDSPATNHGIAENADYDGYHRVFAKVFYRDFTAHAIYGSREKGIPTASFGTVFNDPRTRTVDARGYLDLQYEREVGGRWALLGRLYYDQYNYDGTYIYDHSQEGGPSRVLNRDYGHGKWWGGELNLGRTLRNKDHFVVGVEYRDNFQQDQGNFDVNPFVQYFEDHHQSQIGAAFVQGDIALRSDLVLNLGLRYDHYSTFGGTTNPRAAFIYRPLEKTTLKLLYARAFRPPNAYELYYAGVGLAPNPQLRPEAVNTGELVLEQYLGNHFSLTTSAFRYHLHDLISQQTDPSSGLLIYKNTEHINGNGLEFEARRKSSWGLEGGMSYSLQEAAVPKSGLPLTNLPRHLGKLKFSAPLSKRKLFASLDLEYMSRRRTLGGNFVAGHAVPNLTLFSRPSVDGLKSWELSASLYNLFDTRYGDPGGEEHREDVIFQDGRGFRLKAMYRF
jgi:iron complex outermembrane receptor protein